jgi:hypothetical protein
MDPIPTDPLIGYVVSVFLMIMTLTSLARFFGLGKEQKSPIRLDPDQMKEWTRQQSVECGFQHRDIKEDLLQVREQGKLETQILQSILGNSREVSTVLKQLSREIESFHQKLARTEQVIDQVRQDQMIDIRVQADLEQLGKRLEDGNKDILKYVTKKQ